MSKRLHDTVMTVLGPYAPLWDAARHKRVMRRTTLAGEGPTADPPFATRTPAWDGIIPHGVGV